MWLQENRLWTGPFLELLTGLSLAAVGACDGSPVKWTEPITGIALVRLPPGSYAMGSPAAEAGREAHERQHRLRISRPFYVGATEVT